ncbi:putative type III restriction-modification system: methylase [Mesomycoplasma hyopneumoniae 7422]|nr:putative type III restriction-modification system: methylase [Mesomycoplasma hyopneumoniae 7422]
MFASAFAAIISDFRSLTSPEIFETSVICLFWLSADFSSLVVSLSQHPAEIVAIAESGKTKPKPRNLFHFIFFFIVVLLINCFNYDDFQLFFNKLIFILHFLLYYKN